MRACTCSISLVRVLMALGCEDMELFMVEAVVCGYHVYQAIWAASHAEELPCQRESGNPHDPVAVAIVRSAVTVGQILPNLYKDVDMVVRLAAITPCQGWIRTM